MSKLLSLLPIRPPQQPTFRRQLRKEKAVLPSNLLLEYSAVMLFSTASRIECMMQRVRQNCPGNANRVRLARTLFHETVTVRSDRQ